MKRLLFLLCLIPVFGVAAYAQSTPPENPKYKQFKGQASAPANPPSGSYRMYVDNTGAVKIVNSSGVATAVGGSYDKLTQSGANNGTLTLYDDTASTGVSNFTVRAGAGQTGGGAGDTLFGINDGSGGGLGRFQYVTGGGRFQMVKGPSGYASFAVVTDNNFNSYRWYVDGYNAFERFPSDGSTLWSSTTDASGTSDIGLARASAGVLKVTDGSSGLGELDANFVVSNFALIDNYFKTGDTLYVSDDGWDGARAVLSASSVIQWVASGFPAVGTPDLGLARASAGVLKVTDGSTGSGSLNVGAIIPNTDNTYDIGDSTHQVRSLYIGTSMQGWQTKTLTESTDTGFVDIALAQNTVIGGYVEYVVRTTNGTDYTSESGQVYFTGASKTSGTVDDTDVGLVGTPVQSTTAANTFTNVFTSLAGTNKITLRCKSDSTLTGTDTITLFYRVHLNGAQTETITGL